MRTNYSIAFAKPTAEISAPNTIAIGTLTVSNAFHSNEDEVYWGQNILGELVSGSFNEVIEALEKKKETPEFIIVFGRYIEGMEIFIDSLNTLFPHIPVVGGVSAKDVDGHTLLYPANDADIMVLLSYDKNYVCGNVNAYPVVIESVEIQSAEKNKVSKVLQSGIWVNAADFYRSLQRNYSVDDSNLESIVLSDHNGRNVHSVIYGNNLDTTADLSDQKSVSIRVSNKRNLIERCHEIFSAQDTLFFACAGIQSMFVDRLPAGSGSLVGYFHGEIGYYNQKAMLQGLSISYIKRKNAVNEFL